MRRYFSLFLVFVVSGCIDTLPRYPVKAPDTPTGFYEDRRAPGLAILEYRVAKYLAWSRRPTNTVCVAKVAPNTTGAKRFTALEESIENKFRARFRRLSKLDACVDAQGMNSQNSAVFFVDRLECPSRSVCTATAEYRIGAQGFANRYRASWRENNWHLQYEPEKIELTAASNR